MSQPIGKSTVGEMLPIFIIFALLILFAIFCIKRAASSLKVSNQLKNEIKMRKKNGMTIYVTLSHISGLPIANVLCQIFSYPDKFEFISGKMKFLLSKDKIKDMRISNEKETHHQYVSSIGDAVRGATYFGPRGAIIGGRPKKYSIDTFHSYLIITYMNQGNIQYIRFYVGTNKFTVNKLIKEFNYSPKQSTTIDL